MWRVVKIYKNGLRRESPLLRYIDCTLYLAGQPKCSNDTSDIITPFLEGRKATETEGWEACDNMEAEGWKAASHMRDSEISNAAPNTPTQKPR